jgi:anti-sigma factor RsiW
MLECQDCEKYLEAFLDSALDVKETLDVQEHLLACARCAGRAEAEQALRAFVRQHAATLPLPQHRKRQVIREAMLSARSPSWWKRQDVVVSLRGVVIGMAAAAALAFLVLRAPFGPSQVNDMVQQLSREASMTYRAYTDQYPPLEVTRSNGMDVVKWVKSHMGSRLKVPWITDKGTRLLGGRLCRILDRKSAVLVYRRRGANVLLFAFKGDPLSPSARNVIRAGGHAFYVRTVSGRPVAVWQHEDTTYSLVGTLNRSDLLQLVATVDYR